MKLFPLLLTLLLISCDEKESREPEIKEVEEEMANAMIEPDLVNGGYILHSRESCDEPWTQTPFDTLEELQCSLKVWTIESVVTGNNLKSGLSGTSNPLWSRDGYGYAVFPTDNGSADGFDISVLQEQNGTSTQQVVINQADIDYPFGDLVHALPSIAVDEDGYIWVAASMRLNDPQMWRSDNPHDITSFTNQTAIGSGLPDVLAGQYPVFMQTPDGSLLLWLRSRTNASAVNWRGSSSVSLYKLVNGSWQVIGTSFNATPSDQGSPTATGLVGKVWTLPASPTLPSLSPKFFWENDDTAQRFFRYPIGHPQQGQTIDTNSPDGSSPSFGFQAYRGSWQCIGSRLYVGTVVTDKPTYIGTAPPTVDVVINGTTYTYDGEEYVLNYTRGLKGIVIYTDDNGATWHNMQDQLLTFPIDLDQVTPAYDAGNEFETAGMSSNLQLFETTSGNIGVQFSSGGVLFNREFVNGSWTPYESEHGNANFIPSIVGAEGSHFTFSTDFATSGTRGADVTLECGRIEGVENLPTYGTHATAIWGNISQFDKTILKSGKIRYQNSSTEGGEFNIITLSK